MKRISEYLSREKVILGVYALISIIIALQHYRGGPDRYNNFRIFRAALWHLIEHKNLHLEYPAEYWDLFLYNPSFCVLFAPFALMPVGISIVCWSVCCAAMLFYAIRSMPLTGSQKVFFWWFILIELVTSLHSQQTNPVIAALGLFTFSFLEKGKTKWAALFPILAFCIKGYGGIFAGLFLFYPRKGEYVAYSVVWAVLLALLPLPLTGPDYFVQIYKDWLAVLVQDHQVNYGFSVMGLLKIWFPAFTPEGVTRVQLAGVALLALTWLINFFRKTYQDLPRRILLLAYACLWVILFNHAAESPTYVIAIPGVVLFHIINRERLRPWSMLLIVLAFTCCILAPTDIYPLSWRKHFFEPYLIKVIPCLLIWTVLQVQLLFSHEH